MRPARRVEGRRRLSHARSRASARTLAFHARGRRTGGRDHPARSAGSIALSAITRARPGADDGRRRTRRRLRRANGGAGPTGLHRLHLRLHGHAQGRGLDACGPGEPRADAGGGVRRDGGRSRAAVRAVDVRCFGVGNRDGAASRRDAVSGAERFAASKRPACGPHAAGTDRRRHVAAVGGHPAGKRGLAASAHAHRGRRGMPTRARRALDAAVPVRQCLRTHRDDGLRHVQILRSCDPGCIRFGIGPDRHRDRRDDRSRAQSANAAEGRSGRSRGTLRRRRRACARLSASRGADGRALHRRSVRTAGDADLPDRRPRALAGRRRTPVRRARRCAGEDPRIARGTGRGRSGRAIASRRRAVRRRVAGRTSPARRLRRAIEPGHRAGPAVAAWPHRRPVAGLHGADTGRVRNATADQRERQGRSARACDALARQALQGVADDDGTRPRHRSGTVFDHGRGPAAGGGAARRRFLRHRWRLDPRGRRRATHRRGVRSSIRCDRLAEPGQRPPDRRAHRGAP